jgi:tRNA dimethylallyltransferase
MLKRLAEFDPVTAERLHANDRKRIIRAFEVYECSGISISEQNELSRKNESPYNPLYIGITYEDREKLYERINKRVDIMLENGLLEEAKNSLNKGKTAKQAIGHKEFIPYFKGEITLEEAVENLKRETRRYAKRQLTWFRRNENINWIYADCCDVNETAYKIIESV